MPDAAVRLDLEDRHLLLVRAILSAHVPGAEVVAFGSRVSGTAKPYSDLDLAIRSDSRIDLRTLAALEDCFQESDLPFRVDVLDWHQISDAFKSIVSRSAVVVQAVSADRVDETLLPTGP